jgi:shikimate kinase
MASKIFLLGRPGSGKSAAARYIQLLAEKRNWRTYHINDYKFLKEMYEEEGEGKSFRGSECGGFDVVDFSVLDTALQQVEREGLAHSACQRELVLLEFARNDYHAALGLFSHAFLSDAYLLFFQVDISTCAQRVQERAASPETEDDHYISEEMLRSYYQRDTGKRAVSRLIQELGLDAEKVRLIENMGSWREFCQQLSEVVESVMSKNEEMLVLPHECKRLKEVLASQVEKSAGELVVSCPAASKVVAQPFDRM